MKIRSHSGYSTQDHYGETMTKDTTGDQVDWLPCKTVPSLPGKEEEREQRGREGGKGKVRGTAEKEREHLAYSRR
jgi:hypothetical protein